MALIHWRKNATALGRNINTTGLRLVQLSGRPGLLLHVMHVIESYQSPLDDDDDNYNHTQVTD